MELMKIKNKKAEGSVISNKLVIAIGVMLVVAAGIYAFVKYGGLDFFKNLPIFGGNGTDAVQPVVDSTPQDRYVVALYFNEHWLFKGSNDYYYFIYDENTKNNLKVAIFTGSGGIEGWYADPNENKYFKEGTYSYDKTRNIVKDIMSRTGFDNAINEIAKASQDKNIVSSWGKITKGSYEKIATRDPIDAAFVKLVLKESIPLK